MSADFTDDAVEAALIVCENALEYMLGRAFPLCVEGGYPLLVLLPFRNQRAERIKRIGFGFAHSSLAPI